MNVTFIYKSDDVRVHKTGCRDIDKDARRAVTVYSAEVKSRQDAANNFYSDFVSSGEMTEEEALGYTDFLPCTKGLD